MGICNIPGDDLLLEKQLRDLLYIILVLSQKLSCPLVSLPVYKVMSL